MSTRATTLIVLCAFALTLASCTPASNEEPVRITEADAGSAVELHLGQTLEVALPGNPTTGYTWEVVPGAESVLEQQGELAFEAESELLGAGGVMTLSFEANGQGEATLSLIYHRTFEPGVAPLQTFEVTVLVGR